MSRIGNAPIAVPDKVDVAVDGEGVHRVDYGAVSAADRASLGRYLESLQAIAVSELPDRERMALWINLYNAATVQVILDHYPVSSILEIDLAPPADGPWGVVRGRPR